MTSDTSTASDLRSDADLIVAARSGDAGAFGVLYGRHAGAALVVARQYSHRTSDAEDAVADAFAAVWSALRGGAGPTDAFRAYLFTVVRRVSAVHRTKGRRTEPTDDVALLEAGTLAAPGAEEPVLAGFERSFVARAFAALPERWQAVLWHSEVEGKTPAEIAPLLGLTANGTAALAYRAREGLRQAYLQQHLSDELPDACRAVSGKLGGYVRGGLGARDGAQVESHLETCARCRPLVLELRDVNHGLRSVIAPLVLGVAGLGALKFALPTTGGLAAGTASLASGGVATGTAGATAGAGSTAGGGAAGGGAAAGGAAAGGGAAAAGSGAGVAAAGVGAVGAVGAVASAAGAAGATGTAGGLLGAIGGILASVPTALVAGIAGVVVVAGVTVGAVALNGANQQPSAVGATSSAGPSAPGSTSSADASEPGAGSTPATSPGAGSTTQPGSTPGASLADTASPPGSGPMAAVDSSPASSGSPAVPLGGSPADPGPGTGSTPAATPTATPTPTDSPTAPPPGAPVLVVSDPAGGLVLVAGQSGQVGIDVANTGTAPATGLVAQVDLPAGVVPAGVTQQVAGRFAVHLAAPGWDCVVAGSGVSCTLPVLDAGQAVHLGVTVDVDDTFDAPDAAVTWRVRGAGLPDVVSHPSTVTVNPSAARLTLASPPAQVQLLRGHPVAVQVPVRNAGGSPASPATVTVAGARGLTVTGSADDAWTCTGFGDLTCQLPSLPARTTSVLVLRVVAADGAADGSLGLTLAPVPPGGVATGSIPYQVATPARLSATSSATSLPLAPGAPAVTTITVANGGGLAAIGVTATLTRPAGATWAAVTSQAGWTCPVTAPAAGSVTCSLGSLAAGATSAFTVALDPAAAAVAQPGALVVSLAAGPDADVAAPLSVPTAVSDLALRYRATGAFDVTQVGAPLLGCDRVAKDHCWNPGHTNNDDVAMVPLDLAPGPGLAGRVSSSTALALPRGVKASDVAFAGLYWSADKAPGDSWSSGLGTAQLRGPRGGYAAVTALASPVVVDTAGRAYYQSFADVTAQVKQLGAGTWSLADVAVADGQTDAAPTYYAGWALVVVYRTGAAAPSTVSVYDGPAWVAPGSPRGVVIPTGAGASVRIGVVAWDGDRGTRRDCLALDGTALSGGCGTHPSGQANAFDSTATGWDSPNSLGVDAKGFDPVTAQGATSVLTASTTADRYLLGVVTARVTP